MKSSNLLTLALASSSASAASLQLVSGWGSNPTNIQMYIYVPDKLPTNPAIVVAIHPCGGSGQQMYGSSKLPQYADQYGYIMIFPSTPNQSNCWDNHNSQTMTHNQGGDALGIAQQISYTLSKYNADASRVYATGFSSGAMMSNNLAAAYPNLFAAIAPCSGVPADCWLGDGGSTPFSSNTTCPLGKVIHTPQEWGNFARNGYPGYTGRRPRMQIWHGSADTLVVPALFQEELKQWSNVLGVSYSKDVQNTPKSGYTQTIYGDGTQLVGYVQAGAGHAYLIDEMTVLNFFGIPNYTGGSSTTAQSTATTTSKPGPTTPVSSTMRTTTTSRMNPTTTGAPVGGGQTRWGQCGGIGYSGPTSCQSPATCTTQNAYYAQCI